MALSPIIGKHRALRERIVTDIRAGHYPPATRLPSEWELVSMCGVSRTTVRKALDQLVAEGLVTRQRGQATWVHPEALTRLAAAARPARTVHAVMGSDKWTNPLFTSILAEFHARLPGHIKLSVFFHDFIKPAMYADAAVVVVDGGMGETAMKQLRERGLSLVVLNRVLRGIPCICTDNRHGGELMASHAIERGHRRIGILHFGDRDTEDEFVLRLKGMRAVCAGAGVEPVEVALPLHRQYDFSPNQAVDRLLRMDAGITVILCVCDLLAVNVLESLAERGIKVPERVSVIGFDDLPNSRLLHPPLATVRQPVEGLGESLATAVVALAEGRPAVAGRPIRPQFVPRDSCAAPWK